MTLTRVGGGQYEVSVDGTNVFSKKKEGRFPEDDEVLTAIRNAGGAS